MQYIYKLLSSFAIISLRKTELAAFFNCVLVVSAMFHFLAVLWVGLWSVIAAFSGHTRLLLGLNRRTLHYIKLGVT